MATALREPSFPVGPAQVAGSARALLVVDDDCVCIEASLGASTLLGAARSELVGHPVGDLLEPSAREAFAHVWEAFRESGGHAGPFPLVPPSDVEVEVEVTRSILPGSHLISFEAASAPDGDRRPLFGDRDRGRTPTSRERQVLALLASGSTDTEAAELLALSPATVQTHVRNAKAKLGARTRTQAVALALQRGLIEDVQT